MVKDEYKPIIEAHAKFMIDNKSVKMRIEGNSDERGSTEYNLALGQRRADGAHHAVDGAEVLFHLRPRAIGRGGRSRGGRLDGPARAGQAARG